MFEIVFSDGGEVALKGRLDAAQAANAQEFLDRLAGPCILDMASLDYISSAGLGVLLKTHKRMLAGSSGMVLINVNPHIVDIFRYSGFDKLFEIRVLDR
ncbi:MAG TPA: STAS domain-containing protein [Xanthomonadales bacterium]|nr:STAS domain-containing protein [Xanthomonadales bacterium]